MQGSSTWGEEGGNSVERRMQGSSTWAEGERGEGVYQQPHVSAPCTGSQNIAPGLAGLAFTPNYPSSFRLSARVPSPPCSAELASRDHSGRRW